MKNLIMAYMNIPMYLKLVIFLLFLLYSCGNRTEKVKPVTADADSASIVSVPVSIPPPEQDTALQDSVFSNGTIPTSWINAGISDSVGMVSFIRTFQRWVNEELSDSIVAHVRFPLLRYKTEESFRKKYSKIFNSSFKTAIGAQNPRQIFRSQNGAMIANGKVWLVQEGDRFLISAVNP